jgi:hypothetical protein
MTDLLAQPQCAWHQSQWGYVNHALANDHMPSALLLYGAPGLDKSLFAKQLAARLLCQRPQNGSACGVCSSCLQFATQNHPDYFQLSLSEKSKSISIDSIRELSEKLQRSSHQKGRQVVLFNPISALTVSASHALLKTLEEPLGNVVMIAVLSEPNQILPTLKSRLVTIPFFATNIDDTTIHSKIGLALYDQSPSFLQNLDLDTLDQLALEVLNHVGKSMVPKVSALKAPAAWFKEDALSVIKILYCLCRDAIYIKLGLDDQCIYKNYQEKINYVARLMPISAWYKCLEKTSQGLADAQGSIAFNQQYIIESILLNLQYQSIRKNQC